MRRNARSSWLATFCAIAIAGLISCAHTAERGAADYNGTWHATVTTRSGMTRDGIVIVIADSGQEVTGTWLDPDGITREIAGGSDTDGLRFTYAVEDGGNLFVVEFSGRLENGNLVGEADIRSGDRRFGTMKVIAVRDPEVPAYSDSVFRDIEDPAERFAAVFEDYVNETEVPGGVAAFRFGDDEVHISAAGYADRESGLLMTSDSVMPAGSIGKVFVAALAVDYFSAHDIDLDTPVAELMPGQGWFGLFEQFAEITIRQLLNHSSGIPDYVKTTAYRRDIAGRLDTGIDPEFAYSPEELIRFSASERTVASPGSGYAYSDTNYLIMGLLLENLSGRSYYDYLEDRILIPASLARTIPAVDRTVENLASGYLDSAGPLGALGKSAEDETLVFSPKTEWTGGGLISNSGDLARWVSDLFGGRLIEPQLVSEMISGVSVANGSYGLGVSIMQTRFGQAYGHVGDFPGYRSAVIYYEEYDLSIAVQFNADYGVDTGSIFNRLAGILVD